MTSFREDRLDHAIRQELSRLELTREAADEMVRSWKASDLADDLSMQRRSIAAKIEDRETKKARLADLLLEEAIDMETHKLKRDEMDFELSQLRLRLEELPEPQTVRRERGKFLDWMSNLVHLYDSSDRAGKRQLLRETFSHRLADKSAIKLELEQWANAKLSTGDESKFEQTPTATET